MLPNQLEVAPFSAPIGYSGTKGRGLSYERKVGKWLAVWAGHYGFQLHSHPWLAGPTQPDFVIESASGGLLIIEAKLTQVDCAAQLSRYRAVLGNVPCVQVCRRLRALPTIQFLEDATHDDSMLLWL